MGFKIIEHVHMYIYYDELELSTLAFTKKTKFNWLLNVDNLYDQYLQLGFILKHRFGIGSNP